MTDEEIADLWIKYELKENPAEDDPDFLAYEVLSGLEHKNPERLFRILRLIVDKNDTEKILGMVAAGPLEDLIVGEHGDKFVDRVLDLARQDKRWRRILGGVWVGRSEDTDVQKRIRDAIQLYFPNGTP